MASEPISMRVDVRCPACAGNTTAPCATCGDTRVVEDLFSAWLAVRPVSPTERW